MHIMLRSTPLKRPGEVRKNCNHANFNRNRPVKLPNNFTPQLIIEGDQYLTSYITEMITLSSRGLVKGPYHSLVNLKQ